MSSENFRNEFTSRLLSSLPYDQTRNVLSIFDKTSTNYDIRRKQMSIIISDGIPEVVKYFIASKAVENTSENTLNIYKLRLIDFFTVIKKSIYDIETNDIRLYLYYYKEKRGASDSYLDNIRRILNSFFSWLVINDYIMKNPCSKIEKIKHQTKEREPLTQYELETLRWYCKSIREKAIIDFFYSTGVRLSELQRLNKDDIDWDERSVVIQHGKGNKRRIVFFNAESEFSLRKYLESRTDNEEALFVTIRNPHRRMSTRTIQLIIKNIASRSSMHAYPHKLRHTFATHGLHSGVSLENLQALMGHADPKTTLIYAKLDYDDLQRAHSKAYG